MYDLEGFFVENPADRYGSGNMAEGGSSWSCACTSPNSWCTAASTRSPRSNAPT